MEYITIFFGCKNTIIPLSVKILDSYSFGYTDIESVTIPEGVEQIVSMAFDECTSLKFVSIPSTINSAIGNDCFSGCSSLVDVVCYDETPHTLWNDVFDGVPETAVLKIPVGTMAVYETYEWVKNFPGTIKEDDTLTGVESVIAGENAPVEYYNLQGVKVARPENGIFIKKQGGKTTKVVL